MANSYGNITALSGNANSLANSAYVSLGVIDFGSAPPHECLVEVSMQATGSPTSASQVILFVRSSIDGVNFSDTPASTVEANAHFLGSIALPDTSAHRSKAFAVSPLFGGALPNKVEIFVKNSVGAALASSGQVGQYRTETFG